MSDQDVINSVLFEDDDEDLTTEELDAMGIPSGGGSEFEGEPLSQDRMGMMAENAMDVGTMGFGQYAAGLGGGIGSAVGTFQESDEPLLDRIGSAYSAYQDDFRVAQQAYNLQQQINREQMTPGEQIASTLFGGFATAPLGGGTKMAQTLSGRVLQQGAVQGGLGFIGSTEPELEARAWDAVISGLGGAGFQTIGEASGAAYKKGSEIVKNLWDKTAGNTARGTINYMQGIPPHLLDKFVEAKPAQIKQWIKDFSPPGLENIKVDELDAMAKKLVDDIGNQIRDYRRTLSKEMGEAIRQKYGMQKVSDDHLSFFNKKLDMLEERFVGSKSPKAQEMRDKLKDLRLFTQPRKLTAEELPAEYKNLPEWTWPEVQPTYRDMWDAYKQVKEFASPGYIVEKNILKPSRGDEITSSFTEILEGKDGLKDGFIGTWSPEIRDKEKAYSLMFDAGEKVNSRLLTGKSAKKYLESVGTRGPEALSTMKLDEAIPGANTQEMAERFSTISMIDRAGAEPRDFGKRQLGALALTGGLAAGSYALGEEGSPGTFLPFAITSALTMPITGKYLAKGYRGTKNILGPTKEFADRFGAAALSNPAFIKETIDEYQRRVNQGEPKSPFDE